METIVCDSKGCRRPAAWVRSEEMASPHPNFLCQECWERMLATHSEQADGYVAYHIHTTPVRRSLFGKKREQER